MPVRLVIGRAGTGKTKRCFDAVVAACRADPLGPPVYWLVPKQATFMTERMLTCESGLGGFVRARVLSFDALGEEILAECGGAAIPEVTALGRQMILGHLLRRHQKDLRFFAQAARHAGLATKLDATFADFERHGRDAADLANLQADLSHIVARTGEQQALFDKVHDLRLIYDAYTAYLGQERLDRHRRLEQVLTCISTSRAFKGAKVYVDGFAAFSEYERAVLAQLGKACDDVEIMLLMDPKSPLLHNPHAVPDEFGWFHPVEQTYRQLWFAFTEQHVPVDETVVLSHVHRFKTHTLQTVETQLQWRISKDRHEPEGLELIEAENRRAEVDAVARRIRELWAEGVRLRDMAVLVRDLDPYHELIAASFREHEIEYFVDRRRPVGHHPLLQFLRAVLSIAQSAWPHDSIMTVLKSGLSGMTDDEADELENYVLAHRIRGSAWTTDQPWAYSRSTLAAEDESAAAHAAPDQIDPLRWNLVQRLRPFIKKVTAKDATVRQLVLAVFELFQTFKIEKRLVEWMEEAHGANRLEQRDEHAQVWKHLVDLLDQMTDLLGDEPATLADFIEIYESGLEQFDLALTPPTTDELLVGQVDRTRCPGDLRVCFVLGLNEGVFPRMPGEDSVLSDAERRELRTRKVDIDPDTQRKLLDENLLGYIALTRASERLILTRSDADASNKPLAPSPYWTRINDLFHNLHPTHSDTSCTPDCIGTPRQLIVSLMRWTRTLDSDLSQAAIGNPQSAIDNPTYLSLYHWLSTHPPTGDAIDTMRFRAWNALSYTNQAKLSRKIALKLFPSPLHASVTRIESFAACPFKHFARYALDLRPRDDQETVSALDLGNVFHHVLEKVVATLLAEHKNWPDLPPERRKELIHAVAQEVGQQLRGEIMLSSARNRYLLQRVEQTLEEVTAAQAAAARHGEFAPAFAELTFGPGAALPGLEVLTPGKRQIILQGKIDRVDIAATPDGASAFAVIDYKLSGSQLSLDRVYHGLSLQLLTYLLVLRENGQQLTGRPMTPAAAFYVKLLRQLESVSHPDEADCEDPEDRDLKVKPRGIFEASHLKSLDGNCAGPSKVVNAMIKKDGTLGSKGRSDAADAPEFTALIDHTRARIAALADQILFGQIDIRPYQIRTISPCPHCDYRPVCRFDPALNRYHHLDPLGREEVLQRVTHPPSPAGANNAPSPTNETPVGEGRGEGKAERPRAKRLKKGEPA
jgi:ATP-dependent helicase/nuclease subunit B